MFSTFDKIKELCQKQGISLNQLEEKLRKYEEKLKSDKTGTFAKIWTRVKQFFVKILAAITKAINKAVRFVKQKVAKRKIKNMMKNGDGLF